MAWLGRKSVEWHQQFYSLLDRESEAKDEIYRLKRCQIVRLADGGYAVGSACHFLEEQQAQTDGLHYVDRAVWTCNGFVPVTYLIMPPWLRTRAG
jgi:hypothetical protein